VAEEGDVKGSDSVFAVGAAVNVLLLPVGWAPEILLLAPLLGSSVGIVATIMGFLIYMFNKECNN